MKFIAVILLSVCFCIARGQTIKGQNEVSVSCGFFPFQDFNNSQIIGGGSAYTDFNNTSDNIFFTFRHFFRNRFALGITFGAMQFNTSSHDDFYTANWNIPYRKCRYRYTTLAVECLKNYLNRKYVRLYYYLGAGPSFVSKDNAWLVLSRQNYDSQTTNEVTFNMQLTPIGISVGGRLNGYFEAGIGYKGFLNAGISYRLRQFSKSISNKP